MKLTKKTLAFLLALTLLIGTLCVSAVAQSENITAAIEAIAEMPDPSTITDPNSQEYNDAMMAALNAIYWLAECTEEEMLSIADYHKPFDAIFVLLMVPVDLDNAPTEIPTSEEEVMQQAEWLASVSGLFSDLPEQFSVMDEYTTKNEDGDTLGSTLMNQVYEVYYGVMIRITAYTSTLPEDKQEEIEQKIEELLGEETDLSDAAIFAEEMAKFPEEFTEENLLEYISDFYTFSQSADYFDMTAVNQEDLEKFEKLTEEFQVVIGVHKAALAKQLEEAIADNCDMELATSASPLKKQLTLEPELYPLSDAIYAFQSALGENADCEIQNLDLFYEYYEAVLGYGYAPSFEYGDVDEDGDITAADALLVLQSVVGKYYLTEAQTLAADVDENGDVSAEDALNILKYIVGKVESLPVY